MYSVYKAQLRKPTVGEKIMLDWCKWNCFLFGYWIPKPLKKTQPGNVDGHHVTYDGFHNIYGDWYQNSELNDGHCLDLIESRRPIVEAAALKVTRFMRKGTSIPMAVPPAEQLSDDGDSGAGAAAPAAAAAVACDTGAEVAASCGQVVTEGDEGSVGTERGTQDNGGESSSEDDPEDDSED